MFIFFLPFSNFLYPASSDVPQLRQLCADYMSQHVDDFAPFLDVDDGADAQAVLAVYCEKLVSSNVWGGQLELRSLASALRTPIIGERIVPSSPPFFSSNSVSVHFFLLVYAANTPEVRMGDEFEGEPLQLSYHQSLLTLGEHYNSVVSK